MTLNEEQRSERTRKGTLVTLIGLFANLFLAGLKMAGGLLGRSSALIADSVHSLSDISTDLAVIFGLRASEKPRDKGHDFGHGKFETMVTAIVGLILIGVSLGLGFSAIRTIIKMIDGDLPGRPGLIAIGAAAISIIVKELLFRYTIHTAKRTGSSSLAANAWHHRSDSLSSIAALFGVGGAYILGGSWVVLDPAAAIVVVFIILYVAIKILKGAFDELTEASLDERTESRIMNLAKNVPGVRSPHNLRTRSLGKDIAVDIHIKVDPDRSVKEGHDLCLEVENAIKDEFGEDTIVSVHVDPDGI